jgi:hypothetical protein
LNGQVRGEGTLDTKSTYTIMNDTFESVLQLLLQSIRLQNIDDADEEEQPLAFVVTCWNATGTTII